MGNRQKVQGNERGFASLVVALVMILILSLLTVGFARLARREQQSSLDKQLATQAYYAAETGINDIVKAIPTINTYNQAHPNDIDPNVCLTTTQLTALGLNSTIDPVPDISYTCALVDLTPSSIVYNGLGARSVRQTAFATNGQLSSLTVSWGTHASTPKTAFKPNIPDSAAFTPDADWGNNTPAVLQVSITPLDDVTRDALIDKTFTAYLYPSSASPAGSLAYATSGDASNAPIFSGHCSALDVNGRPVHYPCNATISGIENNGANGQYYMVRVMAYYDKDGTDISVNNLKDAGGTQLNTVDGQAQIDVTGKAKNVLKRIQVRSPLHPDNAALLPSYAIDSQGTCKRTATTPQTAYDGGSTIPDTDAFPGNDVCDLQKVR
ncbi:MAG TPA: pilus assembly PilX N-terminal domain-containing protein [Candidatus Saccharimonadales bacterium]